jgi:perosamine synthetase
VARKHGVALVEDAAQAFHGDGYRGDPGSAVTMFSFGPIKTATALGGGVLRVRDAALAARIRTVLRAHRPHTRIWFLQRVLRFAAMKLLSMRLPFTLFVAACRMAKVPYDELLREWVRGFRGGDLLGAVRRAPPAPLVALMERRLRQDQASRVEARRTVGQRLADDLTSLERPGRLASRHSFWVFPILAKDPERRVRQLVSAGYDVTAGASSLTEIQPRRPDDATCALRPLAGWLYLPQPDTMSARERERLVELLSRSASDLVDARRDPSGVEGDAAAD